MCHLTHKFPPLVPIIKIWLCIYYRSETETNICIKKEPLINTVVRIHFVILFQIITTLSRKETTVAFPLTITVLNVMGPKEAKFPLESYVRERGNPKPWHQPEEDFPGGDTTQLRWPMEITCKIDKETRQWWVRENGWDHTRPGEYARTLLALRETWHVTRAFQCFPLLMCSH